MPRKKIQPGLIASSISSASKKLYGKIPQSFIGSLVSGERSHRYGLFSYLKDKIKFQKRVSTPFKRFMARSFDRSLILNKTNRIISAVPLIQMKTIGLFLFAFGLVCSAAGLLDLGLSGSFDGFYELVYPLIISASGGILTLSQKSCYEATTGSKILSSVVFGLFGIKKRDKYLNEPPITKGYIGFIAGIVAGIIGTVLGPMVIIRLIISLIVLTMILRSPESGAVLMFLALPIVSASQFSMLTALAAFSWTIKLIRGKRTLKIGFFEFVMIAFALSLLFGGSISLVKAQSINHSILLACGILGYFLVANTVKTADWINRCVNAVLISFGAKLVYGALCVLSELFKSGKYSFLYDLLKNASHSPFSYNSFLAVICVALLPFFFTGMFKTAKESSRSFYIVFASIAIYCLISGHSSGALVSAVVGAVLLLTFSTPRSLGIIASSLIIVPSVILVLPSSVINSVLNAFGISDMVIGSGWSLFSESDKLVSDVLTGGVGIGEASGSTIFSVYGYDLSYSLYDRCDSYTALLLGIGITGLFIFAVLVISFAYRFLAYLRASRNDNAPLKNVCICSFSGAFSILIMAFTANIFSDPSVFHTFFLLCALVLCSANAAKNDRKEVIPDGPYLDISYENNAIKKTRKDA